MNLDHPTKLSNLTYYLSRNDKIMVNEYPKYQRQMPDATRQKISQTMKSRDIQHSPEWNQKISQSLKATWAKVPPKADVK